METLTVGDEIKWRGGFGKEAEQTVRVAGIQVNEFNGSDEGVLVNSVPWHRVKDRRVILQLANTHWCWAYQASPLYDDEDVIQDLIGYLVLLKISFNKASEANEL